MSATSPPTKKARLSPSPVDAADTAAPFTNPDASNVSQTDAEIAVGITEYVNPTLPSWTGVLKQRYTDFLVNEVDEAGNVVHLKSTRAPKAPEKVVEVREPEVKKDDRVNAAKPEPVAVPEVCTAGVKSFGPWQSLRLLVWF